jgi:hypothetical protein
MSRIENKRSGRGFRRGGKKSRRGVLGSMVRSLRSPDNVTMIRLCGTLTASNNSSGILAGVIPCDPSASGLSNAEFVAYWVNLYGEIKLHAFSVQFIPSFEESKGAYPTGNPLAIATSLSSSFVPNAYSTLVDNADSKLYNILNDTTRNGYTHRFHTGALSWGSTASPAGLSPSAGTPGSIGFYGTNYGSTVSQMLFMIYEGFYLLRNRI